jgi:hypothetical protein
MLRNGHRVEVLLEFAVIASEAKQSIF